MKKYHIIKSIAILPTASLPIIAAISCSSDITHHPLLPTYTGIADQMIALKIIPDYYPLQFGVDKPFSYLTNPKKFMVDLANHPFKQKFVRQIENFMSKLPSEKQGTSWWNQQALEDQSKQHNENYWMRQSGDVVLCEQFLLDDGFKAITGPSAPRKDIDRTIITNFRWSRDPYTKVPKEVIYAIELINIDKEDGSWSWKSSPPVAGQEFTFHNEKITLNQKHIKIIESFINLDKNTAEGEWLYNYRQYAMLFHEHFLDNPQYTNEFKQWMINETQNVFDSRIQENIVLKHLFAMASTGEAEKQSGLTFDLPALPGNFKSHHPIYEQQESAGEAPMFEGAVRDNMFYLFNVASQISNLTNFGTVYGSRVYNNADKSKKAAYDKVKKHIEDNLREDQVLAMKSALSNSKKISQQLWERLKNMKDYFKSLGAEGKTFGIFTINPLGDGKNTVQGMSKFSFLYRELGFKQPLPKNIVHWTSADIEKHSSPKQAQDPNAFFNMDDNGWWWNIGDTSEVTANRLNHFSNQIDIGVITARDKNYQAEIENQNTVKLAFKNTFKNSPTNLADHKVDYDLWNEGIKTPFVFHMVLDQIIEKVENWSQETSNYKNSELSKKAKSWGKYFEEDFVN